MLCILGSLEKRFFFAFGLAILSLLLFLNWALVDSLTRLFLTKAFRSFIKSILASVVSAFLQHLPTSVRFRINDIIIYSTFDTASFRFSKGTKPKSIKYPFGPLARFEVNSFTYSSTPGITPMC